MRSAATTTGEPAGAGSDREPSPVPVP
jgi:hypothetical protein